MSDEKRDTRASYLSPVSIHGNTFFPDPIIQWLGNIVKPWDGKSRMRAAIMGIPFDGGTVSDRRGSRHAPARIREYLYSRTTYLDEHGSNIVSGVYDCGNVDAVITDFDETMRRLRVAAGTVFASADHALALGGDHSLSYELIRAARASARGKIGLIHFDAHRDVRTRWGNHSGYWLRQLLDEEILTGQDVFQIGVRGSLYSAHYIDYVRRNGIHELNAWDLQKKPTEDAVNQVVEQLGSADDVYMTFDIDAVDQAFAPGTDFPTPGGLTSREAIFLVYELTSRMKVKWLDIMEVSPPHDMDDQTVKLASELAAQYLHAVAKYK